MKTCHVKFVSQVRLIQALFSGALTSVIKPMGRNDNCICSGLMRTVKASFGLEWGPTKMVHNWEVLISLRFFSSILWSTNSLKSTRGDREKSSKRKAGGLAVFVSHHLSLKHWQSSSLPPSSWGNILWGNCPKDLNGYRPSALMPQLMITMELVPSPAYAEPSDDHVKFSYQSDGRCWAVSQGHLSSGSKRKMPGHFQSTAKVSLSKVSNTHMIT